jgi:outer membrane protein OmpA-like peptidoglycan-associated protein
VRNDQLSLRRAEAVRAGLDDHGGAGPSRRQGERAPLAPNTIAGRDTPEGHHRNRRVEVLLDR